MRKIFLLIILLISCLFLSACSSNNLEENGLLKSAITGDGVHLNSKENYEILFNNIKEQRKQRTRL